MELYNADERFPGFSYPAGLEKIADLGIEDLDIWFLMDASFAERYCQDINNRYPGRNLVPFAKRGDCDDVACFEADSGGAVTIIHDFADPGWEQREVYPDFWSWFEAAVALLVERSREEEVYEL